MKISGAGLHGVLRMTWMQDNLAHVLDHSDTDETPGTWTGLACPDHGLPLGTYVDNARLRHLCAVGEIADIIWETPDALTTQHRRAVSATMQAHHAGNQTATEALWHDVAAVWSHAWAANYAALEFLQHVGLEKFAPVKPQRWVIASFEHHSGPHGLPHPHVHNIVVTTLTTGTRTDGSAEFLNGTGPG